jgi:cell division transport system permease protein
MARNVSLSAMTVLILVLMLLSVNTIIVIRVLTDEAIGAIKDQIDLSIFFDYKATGKQIDDVQSHVKSFPEVTNLTFLTREEVLDAFKRQHAGSAEVLASLDELGENPLGPTLIVKTRDPSDYEKIISSLNVPEYEHIIEAKTFADTEKAIHRIQSITNRVQQFSVGLSALFAFIAFLIIFNTIRVAIYTQRIEISIKKLVGATNWFISGPYLVEAVVFSLVAAVAAYAASVGAAQFLDPYVAVVFGSTGFLTSYFSSHILLFVPLEFISVLLLTALTSLLAMRRYLRV